MTTHRYAGWVATEAEWVAWRAEAEEQGLTETDLDSDFTRPWNPDRHFLGIVGEECFSRLSNTARKRGGFYDGGEDFPGVDAKAVPYYDSPLLMRAAEKQFKAPVYFLAAVDPPTRRVRGVGYATRAMLLGQTPRDYRFGPTHTLTEGELLGADELIVRLHLEARLMEAVL